MNIKDLESLVNKKYQRTYGHSYRLSGVTFDNNCVDIYVEELDTRRQLKYELSEFLSLFDVQEEDPEDLDILDVLGSCEEPKSTPEEVFTPTQEDIAVLIEEGIALQTSNGHYAIIARDLNVLLLESEEPHEYRYIVDVYGQDECHLGTTRLDDQLNSYTPTGTSGHNHSLNFNILGLLKTN